MTDKDLVTYEAALKEECARLYKVISALPDLICSTTTVTLRDFEEKIGMSKIEVLLDGWERVIDHINEGIRCRNENALLTKQFDTLREAIYSAVEQSLRPIRDSRVSELFLDSDTPL